MELLVDTLRRNGLLAAHLNTRDERPIGTIGRFDSTNIALGVKHAAQLARLLTTYRAADVYVPVSQSLPGFLRDSVFLFEARVARRRVHIHLHGGSFQNFYTTSSPVVRWWSRLVLSRTHRAWVLTPSLVSAFDGIVPRERVIVVENAVPDPDVLRSRASSRRDGFRILYLGNLLPSKGCFDLVEAVKRLDGRARGWQIRLAGWVADAVRARLETDARQLAGSGVTLEVLGPVTGSAKAAELRDADVLVLPTRYPLEGQPLVLLEAMAAGLPVVSTRHAGIPDTIRHGTEGLLVARGNVDELAQALSSLAEDPDTREAMARSARRRYEDRYRTSRFERDVLSALDAGPMTGRTGKPTSGGMAT